MAVKVKLTANVGLGLKLGILVSRILACEPGDFPFYLSRHDHEKVLPLPLLASGVRSGCFKVSQGVSGPERFLS